LLGNQLIVCKAALGIVGFYPHNQSVSSNSFQTPFFSYLYMSPLEILLLYIAFRIKQYVCDFVLQTDWMALTKGKPGAEGYKALFSHTIYHGVATTVIALVFAPALWWLGLVDFIIHSIVDRTKGLITYRKGWSYDSRWFWWSFGLDQEAHNYTHLAYIVLIVMIAGGIEF